MTVEPLRAVCMPCTMLDNMGAVSAHNLREALVDLGLAIGHENPASDARAFVRARIEMDSRPIEDQARRGLKLAMSFPPEDEGVHKAARVLEARLLEHEKDG